MLAWGFAFILAEAIGFVASSGLSSVAGIAIAVSLGQAVTVIIRVVAITFLAPRTGVALSGIFRSPPPKRAPVLLAITLSTGVLAYLVNQGVSLNVTRIIQYSNFELDGAVWTVPFAIAYYLSEIVLLNYLYMLAKKSWTLLGSQSLAAAVFLILGWASLHAITQNLVTAIFAVALVPILYASYEYAGKSPLTPILLWFVILVF